MVLCQLKVSLKPNHSLVTMVVGGCWMDVGGSSKLPGRVEYLPIEWHTKFRDRAGEGDTANQSGHLRLRDITLCRIPHLRSFVNDALLDVLYFMSPTYHQVSLLITTTHHALS